MILENENLGGTALNLFKKSKCEEYKSFLENVKLTYPRKQELRLNCTELSFNKNGNITLRKFIHFTGFLKIIFMIFMLLCAAPSVSASPCCIFLRDTKPRYIYDSYTECLSTPHEY